MSDVFVDSNVCVYAFDKVDTVKQQKAFDLLKDEPSLSSQVIIESYNACRKKLKLPQDVCEEHVLFLADISLIVDINDITIRTAITIKRKYRFSFLDSMIVVAAIVSNCSILYSEDMQHKQIIENKLTIINPFV